MQFFYQLGYKEISNQLLNLIRVRDKISMKKTLVKSFAIGSSERRGREREKSALRSENVFEGKSETVN